jgi:hypothetical protein
MLALLIALTIAGPTETGQTLTGVVRDEAGKPVPQATIFIRTAGPRRGVGVL